jgi:prepilin-type processing-associated H-X9-DG protein
LLVALVLPALGRAREAANASACGSNIRQLAMANVAYATDGDQRFVPAAEDVFTGYGGTRRWHGQRLSTGVSSDPEQNRFDPARGPLAGYLGSGGAVKRCPSFEAPDDDGTINAFEAAAGGYGYNDKYVGGRYDLYGATPRGARETAGLDAAKDPARTVMFADAAFMQAGADGSFLVEYSFSEPPLLQDQPGPPRMVRPIPSIHFRHNGEVASVAWVDGHVQAEAMTFAYPGPRGQTLAGHGLGWFGPEDNSWFDLE